MLFLRTTMFRFKCKISVIQLLCLSEKCHLEANEVVSHTLAGDAAAEIWKSSPPSLWHDVMIGTFSFVTLWLAPASAGRRTRERMPRLSSYKAPGINVGLAFFFGPARNTCCRESRRMEMSPPSGRTRWTWHSSCENHFNLVTVEKYSDQMVEICNQHNASLPLLNT